MLDLTFYLNFVLTFDHEYHKCTMKACLRCYARNKLHSGWLYPVITCTTNLMENDTTTEKVFERKKRVLKTPHSYKKNLPPSYKKSC